jgi:hypothetical protein
MNRKRYEINWSWPTGGTENNRGNIRKDNRELNLRLTSTCGVQTFHSLELSSCLYGMIDWKLLWMTHS